MLIDLIQEEKIQ